jgi:hypothetical protein
MYTRTKLFLWGVGGWKGVEFSHLLFCEEVNGGIHKNRYFETPPLFSLFSACQEVFKVEFFFTEMYTPVLWYRGSLVLPIPRVNHGIYRQNIFIQ